MANIYRKTGTAAILQLYLEEAFVNELREETTTKTSSLVGWAFYHNHCLSACVLPAQNITMERMVIGFGWFLLMCACSTTGSCSSSVWTISYWIEFLLQHGNFILRFPSQSIPRANLSNRTRSLADQSRWIQFAFDSNPSRVKGSLSPFPVFSQIANET